jgi:hypothetical protein
VDRGQLLTWISKADVPISKSLLELQQTLQKLSLAYIRTSVGKKDLLLTAAAV